MARVAPAVATALLAALVLPAVGQDSRPASRATSCPVVVVWVKPLQAETGSETVRITQGDRPVLLYRFAGASRPYIKELYTPGGVQVLLDAPADHVHHHGAMFALAVDGIDFWAEGPQNGKEVHRSMSPFEARWPELREKIDWLAPDGRLVLLERRQLRPHQVEFAGTTTLTWSVELELPPEVEIATLSGSHYFGLGLRFVPSMDKSGTFITAAADAKGEVVRGDETLYPGPWCAYTARVDGKPVTVALFDHPQNDFPATWFTMKDPFAFLAATLRLHKEPRELRQHWPLTVEYGIAAWDGAVDRARIDELYRLWRDKLTLPPSSPAVAQPPDQANPTGPGTQPASDREPRR